MRGRYIWAVALVLVGLWLLLGNIGWLPGASWGIFWSLVLIVAGVVLILEAARRGRQVGPVDDTVPLGTAVRGKLTVKHGAGRLVIQGVEGPGYLAWGTFGGGVHKTINTIDDVIEAELSMDVGVVADRVASLSKRNKAYEWNVAVNSAVPLDLNLDTGVSDQHLDLSRTHITKFNLNTGASSTVLILPKAAGFTEARINSGAASVKITVPQGVSLRVTGAMGLGSLKVDENRFPKTTDGYESPDFQTAANRVYLTIEGGVGSVEIR
ncbi:MAG: cell wall-active antibiotics response protein [Actinobacteria bacterium]|nr:cell wall-active antibiotics response protein [Actinomycetota bacterium]